MNWSLFSAFLLITILLVLTPGPIVTLVISTAATRGVRAALITVIGTTLGNAVLLACIALGLNWVLRTSAEVFEVMRWTGAAYLVWLGIQKWRAPAAPDGDASLEAPAPRSLYRQGILVNLGNPKAIVFIAALVPQFIEASAPRLVQFVVMVATMCSVDILVMSGYALLASRFRRAAGSARAVRMQNRVFGGLFVSAGLFLAGTSRS